MIKFLFDRFSKMVLVMEIAGVVLLAISFLRLVLGKINIAQIVLFSIVLFLYAFIRFCTIMRWYKDVPRYSGIELQFRKAIVPTSYIIAITFAWFALIPSAIPLVLAAFLLAIIAHVNVILLYFHFRDHDPAPVNFYSSL